MIEFDLNKLKGKYILFEGLDETGKSSVLELLYNDLCKNNIKTIKTFQPGDSNYGPIAPLIRSLCKDKRWGLGNYGNLFAFLLDRVECIEKVIKPALDEGKTILQDRGSPSTVAYQLYAKGMLDDFKFFLKDDKKVLAVKEWIENSFFNIEPDYTFYFGTKIGERINDTNDNFDNRGNLFESRLKEAYNEMKDRLDWIEVFPGESAEETLTNLYQKVKLRLELI
jgi:dTMP kinase